MKMTAWRILLSCHENVYTSCNIQSDISMMSGFYWKIHGRMPPPPCTDSTLTERFNVTRRPADRCHVPPAAWICMRLLWHENNLHKRWCRIMQARFAMHREHMKVACFISVQHIKPCSPIRSTLHILLPPSYLFLLAASFFFLYNWCLLKNETNGRWSLCGVFFFIFH